MSSLVMPAKNLTTDQSALLQFKAYITSDPRRVLVYNWSISNPVCQWVGISCDARHGGFTILNLSSMDLGGIIPPHLGNLSFLVNLDLGDNNFYGHLPNELGQLPRLRGFSFHQYHLAFSLQFNNTRFLSLRGNNIKGNVSSEIGKLTNLKIFHMARKHLSGTIPWSSMGNISSLHSLSLTNNSLFGSLPDDICNHLPNLESLTLSFNGLSGQLPTSLDDCSKLHTLSLSYNKFTEHKQQPVGNLTKLIREIPQEIDNLQSLQFLGLGSNSLTAGLLPSSIFNIYSLEFIYLHNSGRFGSLPADICNHLPALQFLGISGNMISGTIPKTINNCTSLEILDLDEKSPDRRDWEFAMSTILGPRLSTIKLWPLASEP
ncbi:hypothetical protein Patl1_19192 [Pistacia atlantica]|uniref:Uncharacterized protein n=1 Tax=Pistacia atlantica TaxID=434234 RepID=A0ACC1C065_9ROSI|nr:hypothetical protein Patl1_19192 [Pistacia atlantica]